MSNFGSQASQDLFALGILNYPSSGSYLEIGAGHPEKGNNTWLLEKLNWTGVSIDSGNFAQDWRGKRKNYFFNEDACTFDYSKLTPSVIDYLSIDIDEATNVALKVIPFDKFQFKVITIEHDVRNPNGEAQKVEQRKILDDLGYVRLISDVCSMCKQFFASTGPPAFDKDVVVPFEDWYVAPEWYNDQPILSNILHEEIIKILGFKDREAILS